MVDELAAATTAADAGEQVLSTSNGEEKREEVDAALEDVGMDDNDDAKKLRACRQSMSAEISPGYSF